MYKPSTTAQSRPGVTLGIIVGVTLCAALLAPHTAAGRSTIAEFSQLPAAIQIDVQGLAPTSVTQLEDNSIAASALVASTKTDLEAQGATRVTDCADVLGSEITQAIDAYGDQLVCGN